MASELPSIAVIADAHFHDIFGDYGAAGFTVSDRAMALRPFANTVRSTRVFNESSAALPYALDDIAARGIRHVVLLGDYSDDGQLATMAALRKRLDDYARRFGMRFYAVPGNHDIFGPGGRHRSKRFLNARGGRDLVTSNPKRKAAPDDDAVIISVSMYCAGYPEGLRSLGDVGFFRKPDYLHWETPFGIDDHPSAREFEIRSPDGLTVRRLMDASYLIEPFDGVWMLMIDANVFVPVDRETGDGEGAFTDSTDAGWNAMLVHKRFILDWIRSVTDRARTLGKTVIAFSHYPALDPLDSTRHDERAVLGQTSLLGRIPELDVGDALIDAGIRLHFSGHLHVNDTARHRNANGFLFNISVPSLVAFPGAYKIVHIGPHRLDIETISIDDMKLDADILRQYSTEVERDRINPGALLQSANYGEFLSKHLAHLVGRRFLRREWPEELGEAVKTLGLLDLAALALVERPIRSGAIADLKAAIADSDIQQQLAASAIEHELDFTSLSRIEVMTFLGDWYRVRMGSDLGLDVISKPHLAAYKWVSGIYAPRMNAITPGSMQEAFGRLFQMFDRFISGLPSRDFVIDLTTGEIQQLALHKCLA
ncbi:metallophosphoesterase [Ochrobactrum sp. Q0168]|uniref:metallophosphoesterase family protein n=1 Tax=Ochrobactrum sp. Q0168 TaxID=2793241 RepID=UPI0018EDF0CB|nr:metallophosphoesterase [Ochrobactrum sp. Q0168]